MFALFSLPFLFTFFTISVYLELMIYRMEMEPLLQNRFQRFQQVVLTFPHLAAAHADQVMMEMTFIVAVVQFVAAAAVVEIELFQKVHFREQVERPIYRSQADVCAVGCGALCSCGMCTY